jgi:hypothetical protein
VYINAYSHNLLKQEAYYMAFTVYDVQQEFISLITTSVTDPNDDRAANSLQWVYDDIPNATLSSAKYPRISVLSFNANSEPHEINSNKQRLSPRIEVQVRVKQGRKFNDKNPQEFVNDLAEDVMESLRTDTAYTNLRTNAGVFRMVLEAENTVYDNDVIVRQLIYRTTMVR